MKQMTKREAARIAIFLPEGVPSKVRVYDSGEGTADRYTVVFTGNYTGKTGGEYIYMGMSGAPFHPQGFCQHGNSRFQIDTPKYGHLGKKIKFTDLPADCQQATLKSYVDLWDLYPNIHEHGRILGRSGNGFNPFKAGSGEFHAYNLGMDD